MITPTRLEERPQVTLRLALEYAGAIVPYARDDVPARAWALSEVMTGRHRIALCPVPANLALAAEMACAGWGRLERESPRMLLAVLTPDGDGCKLEARTEAGNAATVRYNPRLGLIFSGPPAG